MIGGLGSKKYLEFRRKAFHLIAGCFLVVLLYYGILDAKLLLLLVFLSCMLSIVLAHVRIRGLSDVLEFFERKEEYTHARGRGAITFLVGTLLAVVVFPASTAYASILILAMGDSISPLVGRYVGATPHPVNRKKKIEGGIAGGVAGALAASLFVGIVPALIASLLTMMVEMILPEQEGWRRWIADDNIILPLVAGITLTTLL